MSSIIDLVNRGLTSFAAVLQAIFAFVPKAWGLYLLSFIAGILLLLLYGKVSNQQGLKRVKDKIYSYLLESVLFRHEIGTALRAQGRMFGLAAVYLGYALPAILVLAVPCIFLLGQINLWFGYFPLAPGSETVLTARLFDQSRLSDLQLQLSPQLEPITPALRIAEQQTVQWRLRKIETGEGQITVQLGEAGKPYSLPVIATDSAGAVPTGRYSDWWWGLLYPGQESLSRSSGIRELYLLYPERDYSLLGVRMHWIFIFLIVSIVAGLLGSKFFKVEI